MPEVVVEAEVTEVEPEQHEDVQPVADEREESAATSVDWNREFRLPQPLTEAVPAEPESEARSQQQFAEEQLVEEQEELVQPRPERFGPSPASVREHETAAFAAPGRLLLYFSHRH